MDDVFDTGEQLPEVPAKAVLMIPWFLAAGGAMLFGAVCVVVGVRVGRAFAAGSRALEDGATKVQTVFVEKCKDCAEKAHATEVVVPPTDDEIRALLARQAEVDRAE